MRSKGGIGRAQSSGPCRRSASCVALRRNRDPVVAASTLNSGIKVVMGTEQSVRVSVSVRLAKAWLEVRKGDGDGDNNNMPDPAVW